jgi:hypothetical protein
MFIGEFYLNMSDYAFTLNLTIGFLKKNHSGLCTNVAKNHLGQSDKYGPA